MVEQYQPAGDGQLPERSRDVALDTGQRAGQNHGTVQHQDLEQICQPRDGPDVPHDGTQGRQHQERLPRALAQEVARRHHGGDGHQSRDDHDGTAGLCSVNHC